MAQGTSGLNSATPSDVVSLKMTWIIENLQSLCVCPASVSPIVKVTLPPC